MSWMPYAILQRGTSERNPACSSPTVEGLVNRFVLDLDGLDELLSTQPVERLLDRPVGQFGFSQNFPCQQSFRILVGPDGLVNGSTSRTQSRFSSGIRGDIPEP